MSKKTTWTSVPNGAYVIDLDGATSPSEEHAVQAHTGPSDCSNQTGHFTFFIADPASPHVDTQHLTSSRIQNPLHTHTLRQFESRTKDKKAFAHFCIILSFTQCMMSRTVEATLLRLPRSENSTVQYSTQAALDVQRALWDDDGRLRDGMLTVCT